MKFAKIVETETGWSDWILPSKRGYKIACCDCGLVHDFEFEAIEVSRKPGGWTTILAVLSPATYWLRFRARRNERLTAAQRASQVLRESREIIREERGDPERIAARFAAR